MFSTADDNQPAVTIKVYQGEREIASANKALGEFNLEGIPPAARGVPQIEVTFDIDANGILHVSAKDKGTGKEQSIKIDRAGSISKEDIDRMIKDAELHAEDDKKRSEFISAKNELDALIFSTEKSLEEYGAQLSDAEQAELKEEIKKAKEELDKVADAESVNRIKENLSKKAQKLGEIVYSKMQEQQGGAGFDAGAGGFNPEDFASQQQSEEAPAADGPIDADFEVVDDN